MRWLLLLLVGCGGGEAFEVRPSSLDFGEVDFQQSVPAEGYNALELELVNNSKRGLDLSFPDFPEDRLVLSALFSSDSPPTLAELAPGESHVVQIGVLAYELGERDTVVETALRVSASGESVRVAASYTPVRLIDGDSGR